MISSYIFVCSFVLALGIGYYLLNGVHPYTRSANHVHMSNANSDLTNPTDIVNEDDEPSAASHTTSTQQRMISINS